MLRGSVRGSKMAAYKHLGILGILKSPETVLQVKNAKNANNAKKGEERSWHSSSIWRSKECQGCQGRRGWQPCQGLGHLRGNLQRDTLQSPPAKVNLFRSPPSPQGCPLLEHSRGDGETPGDTRGSVGRAHVRPQALGIADESYGSPACRAGELRFRLLGPPIGLAGQLAGPVEVSAELRRAAGRSGAQTEGRTPQVSVTAGDSCSDPAACSQFAATAGRPLIGVGARAGVTQGSRRVGSVASRPRASAGVLPRRSPGPLQTFAAPLGWRARIAQESRSLACEGGQRPGPAPDRLARAGGGAGNPFRRRDSPPANKARTGPSPATRVSEDLHR